MLGLYYAYFQKLDSFFIRHIDFQMFNSFFEKYLQKTVEGQYKNIRNMYQLTYKRIWSDLFLPLDISYFIIKMRIIA